MKRFFISGLLAVTAAISSSAEAKWEVTQEKDAITDATEAKALLVGEGGALQFMCSSKQSEGALIFKPFGYLGTTARYEWRDLVLRVDDRPPIQTRWKYVNEYAAAPSQEEIKRLFDEFYKGTKLVVRAKRYDFATLDATFDLTGTPQAVLEVLRHCGVTP